MNQTYTNNSKSVILLGLTHLTHNGHETHALSVHNFFFFPKAVGRSEGAIFIHKHGILVIFFAVLCEYETEIVSLI